MQSGSHWPAEVLTPEEVRQLLAGCSAGPTGIRNKALLTVLYRCGPRISEALALKPGDYDVQHASLRIRHGKGDKARTIGLDSTTADILGAWLIIRKDRGIKSRAPIFCTLKGTKVLPSYVRTLLPRLARKAGIEKRVHPHALRHTMAVELMRESVPIHIISKQLGHATIATTSRYLDHLNPRELLDTMQQRTWQP